MEVTISDIPEELHMFILSKLDGQSVVKAKRTCKMWACLIENLEKYFYIWLMCCLKEIPVYMLTEIMGYTQLKMDNKTMVKSFRQLPWIFWREIYAEYQRALTIEWTKAQMIDLFYDQYHSTVTALSIHDGKLLTGHEDGSVFSWKNIYNSGLELKLVHKHERMITSMAVTSTCTNVTELLSGKCGTLLVTGSQDYGLFVTDLTKQNSAIIEYYNKQVNSVSCFGPYITSTSNGSFIQGQSIWSVSTDDGLTVTKECKLEELPTSNLRHCALTEDKVYVTDDKGYIYRWMWNDNMPDKPTIVVKFPCPVSSFVYKDNCMLCLLENGELVVINNEGKELLRCDIYQSIQRQPECMAWRGPIFALGTKGGVVYMYLITDIDSFYNLNLSNPAAKVTVESEHVNHIAIGDDGTCPLVAVATENVMLSLFRFQK